MLLIALFRLAFATTSTHKVLILQHKATHQLIMQKARGRSDKSKLPLLVDIRFQVLFHSPPGVLFTFPSRYWFTIGHKRVFSLRWWSTWIPARFLVSRGTQESDRPLSISSTGVSPSMLALSRGVRLFNYGSFILTLQPYK